MDVRLFAFFLTIFFVTMVGFALGFVLKSWLINRQKGNLEERLSRMRVEAQNEIATLKAQANEEVAQLRNRMSEKETLLDEREAKLEERQARIDRQEEKYERKEEELAHKGEELENRESQLDTQLEKISGMSREEAHAELVGQIEEEAAQSLEHKQLRLQREGEEMLERQAQDILMQSIQRYGNSVENDMVSTYVNLPDDETKGKIIGKEGRNIKAFERHTGVQLVVDDTPGQVLISSFDPIRRVVAKEALEALLKDGRIQPARIEQVVDEARERVDATVLRKGREAAQECEVHGLPKELLHILGRLYYRYSYGQNVLQHSIEMAHIANVMAAELGADEYVARAGALLHDIGKAVDHEVEGSHVEIGRRMLKSYGVDEAIIRAMEAHHEEYPYTSLESRIVQTVDAISSARPGARSDNAEMFIQKMENLERIARSLDGVHDAYAISAGREVRIFVDPEEVNDYQAGRIARRVAKQVEQELKYPGEIKVVVVREQRSIEYAR